MLIKFVTSNTTIIFKVANNLQPVRKILKCRHQSSLLNMLVTLFVAQKDRLKTLLHPGFKKKITPKIFFLDF